MSSVWERERVAKMKEREKRDLKSRSDCLFFLRRPTSRSDYIRLWNSITPMKIHISYSLDNSSVFFDLCLFFFCLSSSTRSNSLSFFYFLLYFSEAWISSLSQSFLVPSMQIDETCQMNSEKNLHTLTKSSEKLRSGYCYKEIKKEWIFSVHYGKIVLGVIICTFSLRMEYVKRFGSVRRLKKAFLWFVLKAVYLFFDQCFFNQIIHVSRSYNNCFIF